MTFENILVIFLPIILFMVVFVFIAFFPWENFHKPTKKQDITMLS